MEDLTSKQRAQLRGLANSIDTILHVGKDGIGDKPAEQPGGGRGPGIGHPEPGGTGDWNQIRFVSSNP